MPYSLFDSGPGGPLTMRRRYLIDPDWNGAGIDATYADSGYKHLTIAAGYFITDNYEVARYLDNSDNPRVHFIEELPLLPVSVQPPPPDSTPRVIRRRV